MRLHPQAPLLVDWGAVQVVETAGERGFTLSKCVEAGDLHLRLVEYSEDYAADHWCVKGHVLFVTAGELRLVYQDGSEATVGAGMSYVIGDDGAPHKAMTQIGATVFIVD